MEGKVQKVMQASYFTYLWGNPLQTDFQQILHIRRYARRSHLCKFWYRKINGFGIYGGSNFGFSHWNGWSPLQQCCATAQPVIGRTWTAEQRTTTKDLFMRFEIIETAVAYAYALSLSVQFVLFTNTLKLTRLLLAESLWTVDAFLLQNHLQKTEDPLRPIAVVKEGKENKDFLSALAA